MALARAGAHPGVTACRPLVPRKLLRLALAICEGTVAVREKEVLREVLAQEGLGSWLAAPWGGGGGGLWAPWGRRPGFNSLLDAE